MTEGIFDMRGDDEEGVVPAWRRRWEREQRIAQSAREVARKRPRPVAEFMGTGGIPEATKRFTTPRAQRMVDTALLGLARDFPQQREL